jgi:hypothetical protein
MNDQEFTLARPRRAWRIVLLWHGSLLVVVLSGGDLGL